MTRINTPKKQPLKAEDWHPADIVCALRKQGWSLRRLATHHGYKQSSQLTQVMQRRWPKGQRLIAEAIGVPPEEIWPSRYADVKNSSTQRRRCAVKNQPTG